MKKATDYKWHNYQRLKTIQLILFVIPCIGLNMHFGYYLMCNNSLTTFKKRVAFQLDTRDFNRA